MDPDSTYTLFTLNAILNIDSVNSIVLLIVLVIVLLLFSAVLSGAEVALFSLSAKDINYIKQKEDYIHKKIYNLIENPKRLLATILIGNNFINIAIIISINILYKSIFHFDQWLPESLNNYAVILDWLFQVIIVTFIIVLFGEVLPKVYATQHNMRLSRFVAPLLFFMDKLLSPLSNFLANSTSFIENRLQKKMKNDISNEEIEHAIELTVKHSATQEEVNIFKGILKFGDITVKQIMKTRLDVCGIDYKLDFNSVKNQVVESGFSRMPVYSESLDEVKGILYTKDLLFHIDDYSFDWHTIIRPAFFVYETKLIEDLLKEFQQKRSHMAIVVDEFGGTSGIVTLEDIMEEIIGEIKDEFDEDSLFYRKIDDNNFLFEGKVHINDMCKATSIAVEEFEDARGESDTIAGLILEIAGKFPKANETISFKNYDFIVLQMDKMRIERVKMTINRQNIAEKE